MQKPTTELKQNQFGNVTLTWTEPMTPDELSDLKELVTIWLRGIERRVSETPTE